MDGDTTERLSQESQCPKDGFNGLLARASAFAGGVLSSIQALAGYLWGTYSWLLFPIISRPNMQVSVFKNPAIF